MKGVPVHGQNMRKFEKPEKVQKVEEEILLSTLPDLGDSPGENTVEIAGYTSDGTESNRMKFEIRYDFKERKKRNLYLVTLGTEKYKSGGKSDLSDLRYSIDDTEDMQKLFAEKNKKEKAYDSIIPLKLSDEEISRSGISKIKELLSKTDVDDTVVFFISGHGVRADTNPEIAEKIRKELNMRDMPGDLSIDKKFYNIYYYMTWDSSSKTPWEKGVPMEYFRSALDGIRSRQKILLIDTCQSGDKLELSGYKPSRQKIEEIQTMLDNYRLMGGEKGITRKKGEDEESSSDKFYKSIAFEWEMKEIAKMFPELRRGTCTIEISAASGSQSALESEKWKNGAFTFTIKEAILEEKAKSRDTISVKSLRKYILDRVERLTEGRQIPTVTRDIPGRDFSVVK